MFHDSLCLSNLLVKRIDLKLCVSQNLKKMLCLIIHRVYKVFDWFAVDGFRCSSALCLFYYLKKKKIITCQKKSARFRPRQTKIVIDVLSFFCFVTMEERNLFITLEERKVTMEDRNISS